MIIVLMLIMMTIITSDPQLYMTSTKLDNKLTHLYEVCCLSIHHQGRRQSYDQSSALHMALLYTSWLHS